MTAEAGAPIVFDASGAMVYDGATTYGYDLADRLVSASGPLGSGAYLYDAQGRRDRRTINGTFTLHPSWSGEEEVAEYDAALTIRHPFIRRQRRGMGGGWRWLAGSLGSMAFGSRPAAL